MKMLIDDKPGGTWYKNYEYWKNTALQYINAVNNIPEKSELHNELSVFSQFMGIKLIYESNLIEGEGLSDGATRDLINENFPEIPDNYSDYKKMPKIDKSPIVKLPIEDWYSQIAQSLKVRKKELDKIIPSIGFKGKSEEFFEVIQHFVALQHAEFYADIFRVNYIRYGWWAGIKTTTEESERNKEWFKIMGQESFPASYRRPDFIYENMLKSLHKRIADRLIKKSARVNAGEYRVKPTTVGDFNISFPSPESVPKAMNNFLKRSKDLFYKGIRRIVNREDMFIIAAKISHDFVVIHPFPDFNGRVSRLLLTMVLKVFDVPFPIVMRGDKRGKKRYIRSLKQANNGDLIPFAALIAMRTAETFQELDRVLERAGLPSLLSFSKKD